MCTWKGSWDIARVVWRNELPPASIVSPPLAHVNVNNAICMASCVIANKTDVPL